MKLQCAFDTSTAEEYFHILEEIHDVIDIIEIGTPTALRYGIRLIQETKKVYPDSTVVADFKICDGGEYEADMAFDAGADIVTAMAFAHDETLAGVIRSAQRHKKSSAVDMMRVEDVASRAAQVVSMGASYICLHNATDSLDFSAAVKRINSVRGVVPSGRLSIAGGIDPGNIAQVREYDPAIVIVGGSIARAQDKRDMVLKLRTAYGG